MIGGTPVGVAWAVGVLWVFEKSKDSQILKCILTVFAIPKIESLLLNKKTVCG